MRSFFLLLPGRRTALPARHISAPAAYDRRTDRSNRTDGTHRTDRTCHRRHRPDRTDGRNWTDWTYRSDR